MKVNASRVIRWSGLAAFVGGIIFAAIQPIHPADALASVNTTGWAVITSLKTVMCLLFLVGITGLYGRQVDKAGWLGLAGFLLLGTSWALQTAFVFAEAFILPPVAPLAPTFVDSLLRSLTSGEASAVNLGALPAIYTLVGVTYILGGIVFGIATFRACILSRWAAGLLAVAAALTPVTVVLPHPIARLAAVPTAIALAWLGFSLWSERQVAAVEPSARTPHLAGLWRSLLESVL